MLISWLINENIIRIVCTNNIYKSMPYHSSFTSCKSVKNIHLENVFHPQGITSYFVHHFVQSWHWGPKDGKGFPLPCLLIFLVFIFLVFIFEQFFVACFDLLIILVFISLISLLFDWYPLPCWYPYGWYHVDHHFLILFIYIVHLPLVIGVICPCITVNRGWFLCPNVSDHPTKMGICHLQPIFALVMWNTMPKRVEVSWVIGVPPVRIQFHGIFPKTLQLLGYPNDYGNPLSSIINIYQPYCHPLSSIIKHTSTIHNYPSMEPPGFSMATVNGLPSSLRRDSRLN